ncbi:MAG: cytochrome c-type biogenesis protein CcmH [Candidatus Marinimicrobia bacterium]|nr:cytochrome c-type biogenesis protein CcmH [Candidatus Neomarinimicrobiota bacterium]
MKKIYIISLLCALLWANNQEELVLDIERSLMATCCWSGTVYDHGNSEMESEIETLVKAGKTKEDVLDHFVNKHGERVLAIPVAAGFNLFVWLAPALIGLISIFIWFQYLKSPIEQADRIQPDYSDIPHSDQIERELKELDQ